MLRNYRLQNYNFKLVFNVLVLMAMSLLFIHSAKASYVPKQALGIIMGLGIIDRLSGLYKKCRNIVYFECDHVDWR